MSREPSVGFVYPDEELSDAAGEVLEQLAHLNLTPAQAEGVAKLIAAESDASSQFALGQMVNRLAGALIATENLKLEARALALATAIGASVGLKSAAAVGRELNLKRATVTKRVNWWADQLGYRNLSYLRSQKTRQRCADAQRANHWRNRL